MPIIPISKQNTKVWVICFILNILLDSNELVFTQKTSHVNEIIGINTLDQLEKANDA